MAKYLLLYHGGRQPESEEEGASVMQAWTEWLGGLGPSLVDGGNPFTPAAKSVRSDGAVGDGPAGSMATGYSIVEADSLDAAAEIATGCPHLAADGEISVFETFEVM